MRVFISPHGKAAVAFVKAAGQSNAGPLMRAMEKS